MSSFHPATHRTRPGASLHPAGGLVLAFALAILAAPPVAARVTFTGVDGTDIAGVVSAEDGIWFSSATHLDWQKAQGATAGRTYTSVLAASDGFFLATADDGSVWRSTNTLGAGFVQRATLAAALRASIEVGAQILAVGDQGFIARSSDLTAGSWVTVASSTSRDLYDVATNELSTVAVGEGGVILRGGILGTEWQPRAVAETRTLRAVVTDANGRYLAVGDQGAAWISDAAGLTWQATDLGTDANLWGAARVGQAVVVVGDGPTLLYSAANFANWQSLSIPDIAGGYDLRAVAGTSTPDWVAVGTRRATLYSSLGLQWITGSVTATFEESWGRIKRRFQP